MPDEIKPKPIGESTPITIGLMVIVLGLAVGVGRSLQVLDEHSKAIAAGAVRIDGVTARVQADEDRANKTGTDLELLKQDSRYTRSALDEALRKLDFLISGGGVRNSQYRSQK